MRILIPFLLLASHALPAAAELYQWKDENGRVHFSDKKPGAGNVTTLQQPAAQRPSGTGSSDPDAASTSAQERQQRLLQVMKQEAAQKEAAQQQAERKRQEREEDCRRLREHQTSSAGRRLFYTDHKDENGNLIYLDDQQRAEYDQQIASAIAERCQ